MIEPLKRVKESNCDALVFIPSNNEKEATISGLKYKENGELLKGGCGNLYTIILFKGEKDNYHSFEEFDAVLVCPFTYCNNMFKEAYYGVIAKMTSTSGEVIDMIRSDLKKEFNLE